MVQVHDYKHCQILCSHTLELNLWIWEIFLYSTWMFDLHLHHYQVELYRDII